MLVSYRPVGRAVTRSSLERDESRAGQIGHSVLRKELFCRVQCGGDGPRKLVTRFGVTASIMKDLVLGFDKFVLNLLDEIYAYSPNYGPVKACPLIW